MIIDENKYIYINIPKTGTTSWKTILLSNGAQEPFHDLFENLVDKQGVNFDNIFSFTVVRNPYDRTFSGYREELLRGHIDPMDFDSFCKKHIQKQLFARKENTIPKNPKSLAKHIMGHVIPQVWWYMRENKCLIDYVGFYENFEDEFQKIAKKIGLQGSIENLQNRSGKLSYSTYKYLEHYSATSIDIINEIYHDDFFHYPKFDANNFKLFVNKKVEILNAEYKAEGQLNFIFADTEK